MNRGLWLKMLAKGRIQQMTATWRSQELRIVLANCCQSNFLANWGVVNLFLTQKKKKSQRTRGGTHHDMFDYGQALILILKLCDCSTRCLQDDLQRVWFLSSSGYRIQEALKDIGVAQKGRRWQKLYVIATSYWTELSSNGIQTSLPENVSL